MPKTLKLGWIKDFEIQSFVDDDDNNDDDDDDDDANDGDNGVTEHDDERATVHYFLCSRS